MMNLVSLSDYMHLLIRPHCFVQQTKCKIGIFTDSACHFKYSLSLLLFSFWHLENISVSTVFGLGTAGDVFCIEVAVWCMELVKISNDLNHFRF